MSKGRQKTIKYKNPEGKVVKLTPKQKIFVEEYLKTGNATKSALKAYDTNYNTASVIASENLEKPSIKQALANQAEQALNVIIELSNSSSNDNVRLQASKDILDRAGYKPIEKRISATTSLEQAIKELE